MALSGVNTLNMLSNGRVQSIVEWSATQNKTANTSTITAKVYSYFAGAIYANASRNVVVNIGGQTSSVARVIGSHPNGVKKLVATVTKTINHATDGSLTTNIKVTNPFHVTYAGSYIGDANHNFNITLDKIPRNSLLTALSNANIPSGSPTFTIVAADPSFTHIVDFKMNNKTLFSRSGLKGGNHNFSLTTAEKNLILQEMENVPSSLFTVVLGTYNGGVNTGIWQSRSATLTVDDSVKPIITSVTYYDPTYTDPYNNEIYIGLSTLKITTVASATSYATIKSIKVMFDNQTYTGAVVDTGVIIGGYNSNRIVVEVTDSRGRVTTDTQIVPLMSMGKPHIGNQFYRSDQSGNPKDDGTRLYGIVNMFNATSLRGSFDIGYRVRGVGSYTGLESGGESEVSFAMIFSGVTLDPNKSYEVKCTMSNRLYTTERIYIIPTAFTTMDIRGNGRGMAFGKVSEKDAFEVAFPTEILDRLSIFSKTNNPIDNVLLRFHRNDGSLHSQFTYDENSQDLKLHKYGKDGRWKSQVVFSENGEISGSRLVTIVESGPNYKKYSDGTMEAWGSHNFGTVAFGVNPYSNIHTPTTLGNDAQINFGVTFVGVPTSVTITGSSYAWVDFAVSSKSTTKFGVRLWTFYNTNVGMCMVDWDAKGRWK